MKYEQLSPEALIQLKNERKAILEREYAQHDLTLQTLEAQRFHGEDVGTKILETSQRMRAVEFTLQSL